VISTRFCFCEMSSQDRPGRRARPEPGSFWCFRRPWIWKLWIVHCDTAAAGCCPQHHRGHLVVWAADSELGPGPGPGVTVAYLDRDRHGPDCCHRDAAAAVGAADSGPGRFSTVSSLSRLPALSRVVASGRASWASGRAAMRAGPIEIFHNGTNTRDSYVGTSCT
jgi:hypothetical protein